VTGIQETPLLIGRQSGADNPQLILPADQEIKVERHSVFAGSMLNICLFLCVYVWGGDCFSPRISVN